MRMRALKLAALVDAVSTNRNANFLHGGSHMEMEMSFSLLSYIAPLLAIAFGCAVVLLFLAIKDWVQS